MDNLFLVEHSYQVEDIISRGLAGSGKWIALGPSAIWYLKNKGFSYSVPEDFYSRQELNDVCLENHRRVEEFCHYADEILLSRDSDLKNIHMLPFFFNIYPLTLLFDSLVGRIFQLKSILNAHQDYSVWAYGGIRFPFGDHDILFLDREPLWGNLLSLPGWGIEMNINKASSRLQETGYRKSILEKNKALISAIKDFLRKSFILNNSLFSLKLSGLNGLFDFILRKNQDSLLVYGAFYNWEYSFPLLIENGIKIVLINESYFKNKSVRMPDSVVCEVLDLITKSPAAQSAFSYSGISFEPFVQDRLRLIVNYHSGICKEINRKMKNLTGKYNLKGLLVSGSPSFISHAVQQSAKNSKLPVFCWQHGFMTYQDGRITQLNEFSDMMSSDAIFTFGDESSKAHSLHADKFSSRVISVGSSSLDELRRLSLARNDFFSKKILYITTGYYNNLWYRGFYPPFSDRNLLEVQVRFIELLKKLSEQYQVSVTVKLAPAAEVPPFLPDIKHHFHVIKDAVDLPELLFNHHVVIVDTPTTTVLQAIAADKPVFVLTSQLRYPDSALLKLKKRAFCSDTPEEIVESVKNYINTRKYPADKENDEFLRAYGSHLNDGRSAGRAVEEVLNGISCFNAGVFS